MRCDDMRATFLGIDMPFYYCLKGPLFDHVHIPSAFIIDEREHFQI